VCGRACDKRRYDSVLFEMTTISYFVERWFRIREILGSVPTDDSATTPGMYRDGTFNLGPSRLPTAFRKTLSQSDPWVPKSYK